MGKYLVEFIGTFFLVGTIGLTVLGPKDAGNLAPLAIGSVLMVMIYAGGHVSGGHYNPAVTLAVTLRGKCSVIDAVFYLAAQVLAAIVASLLVIHVLGKDTGSPISPDVVKVLVAEFLYTFALCWVVLNVATAKATSGNSNYGLAIGFTVLAGAYSVGAISGGSFNPAVTTGLVVYGPVAIQNIWIYLVAEFAAGAVAAIVYKVVNGSD